MIIESEMMIVNDTKTALSKIEKKYPITAVCSTLPEVINAMFDTSVVTDAALKEAKRVYDEFASVASDEMIEEFNLHPYIKGVCCPFIRSRDNVKSFSEIVKERRFDIKNMQRPEFCDIVNCFEYDHRILHNSPEETIEPINAMFFASTIKNESENLE